MQIDFSDLTDRDKEILKAVYRNRYLSFGQIQRVFFGGHHAPVSRRLKKLMERGYLGDFARLVATGGRPKYFCLARGKGASTVRQLIIREKLEFFSAQGRDIAPEDVDPGPLSPTQLETGKNPQDIDHVTEVADVWSFFTLASQDLDGPELFLWETERQRRRRPEEIKLDAPRYDYRLILRHKTRFAFFLGEHDRSLEPAARFRKQKVESYGRLLRSGAVQTLYGFPRFRVLVTISAGSDEIAYARMMRLCKVVIQELREASDLFLFAFFSRLSEGNILKDVWFKPSDFYEIARDHTISEKPNRYGIRRMALSDGTIFT